MKLVTQYMFYESRLRAIFIGVSEEVIRVFFGSVSAFYYA